MAHNGKYTPVSLYDALFENGDEYVSRALCDLLELDYHDVRRFVIKTRPTSKLVSLGVELTLEHYTLKAAYVTRIGNELDTLLSNAFDDFYWVITYNEQADSLWLTINGLRW